MINRLVRPFGARNDSLKLILLFVSFLLLVSQSYAVETCPLNCGSDALGKAFQNLGVTCNEPLKELTTLALKKHGMNSLYDIKLAAQKAGLYTKAVKLELETLRKLSFKGQIITNITGNRHFCLVEGFNKDSVSVYLPGVSSPRPVMLDEQFNKYWDKVALIVSKNKIDLKNYKGSFEFVSDLELKNIEGGTDCDNCNGGSFSTGGDESGAIHNGAESGPRTTEPVIIRNGDLILENTDISIPARGLSLVLKRYYNAQIVSEVPGWCQERGAGSWVIEDGELSGQGDRITSDIKPADFTMELDMQTIQPGSSYAWETAWVNFRFQENPSDSRKMYNGYYFLMHTNGYIELCKWKNGTQYWLVNQYAGCFATNKNHIRIEATGANIRIYINGTLFINYTDPSPVLAAGRIALESYYSHSHFDNVNISSGGNNYNYDFNTDDNEFMFGYGWTSSYSTRLKEYPNHVTLFRENNAKEICLPKTGGTYESVPVNYYSKLTKDGGGFSLMEKDGTHLRFDLSGKLQYIEDRNLNRITLSYSNINGKILLTQVTEPTGRTITFEYGQNNMVTKATDPAGRYLEYEYDGNNLIRVTDRRGNAANYIYDPITRNMTSLIDPLGNTFSYSYSYNDRVKIQTDPLGQETKFNYLWDTTHITNKRNEIYKYNFDSKCFLQSITNPANVLERTTNDANGNPTNYYDKKGNRTQFTYDANGNPLTILNAAGKTTYFTYESTYNRPLTFKNARGYTTNFSYDAKGNLLQVTTPEGEVTSFAYNGYGQLTSTTDARGKTTTFAYDDSYGNLTAKTDALGNITRFEYDILGRLTKVTDALGKKQEYGYDYNDNLISIKGEDGNFTYYSYDANNELLTITDAFGNNTVYTYDCFGNLLTVTDAEGRVSSYAYDTANQMHINRANLLTVTDPNGNITSYAYNSLDRLTRITDAQNKYYQLGYDYQGNLTTRIDPKSQTTSYTFDVLNRLTKISYPNSTSVTYTLDAVGNITKIVDPTGTTNYTFDKVNRLKTETYPDATALAYTYDANGNRTALSLSGVGTIAYSYDDLNRQSNITGPDEKDTQFSYDALSRRTGLTYPNNTTAVYSYDDLNRLSQLLNKNTSLQEISRFIYTYDKLGRKTKVDLLNGSVNYAYDKTGQLLQEQGSVNGQNILADYGFDSVGNRLSLYEDAQSKTYSYNNLNQLVSCYSAAQKLIQVEGDVSDANPPVNVTVNGVAAQVVNGQFSADGVNLMPGENSIRAEATDAAGNLSAHQISVTYQPQDSANCTYDLNGNLTQKTSGAGIETFAYDYENRLKSYIGPGQSAAYAYNGQGKRVSKTVNGTTTKYYYDGDELILEKTGSDSVFYLHGPVIDEIIQSVSTTTRTVVTKTRGGRSVKSAQRASTETYYHYDGLGSTANLTDSAGVQIASYSYKPFGEIRQQSGSVNNPWLFTGRQLDSESGLYYYRNRYYDPKVGRFTTRDPIGIAGGVNLYGYCANDPINATDPFGLDTYYINYELFKSNPNPTRSPISHSYIAITDNGRVTDTYSWGNFGRSQWFHNNPTDMRVAQRAIDSGIGAVWRGGEDLDSAVSTEFGIRENDTTPYDVAFNNCKENAAELLRDAQIRLRQEQQNKKVCK